MYFLHKTNAVMKERVGLSRPVTPDYLNPILGGKEKKNWKE
jgi:hypothetical protein